MIDRTPGYPTFLAAIMLVVGRDLRSVLIAQSAILSLGPLMVYLLGRRLLPPVMALTAGLIAASSPWGAVLAGAPMSDGLFLILLTLIFFLMKLVEDLPFRNGLLGAAFIGLLTGMAVLVRPIWPLVLLVPGALLFCYGPRRKGVWALLLIAMIFAAAPVALWKERNQRVAHFIGISDIPGQTVWRYLAARVRAEVSGQDRHAVSTLAYQEEHTWGLPISSQEADNERWRRAKAVFSKHPFVTIFSFLRSAFEHAIHPSPYVLKAINLNFRGDTVVLAMLWGGLLLASAYSFWRPSSVAVKHGYVDWRQLAAMLFVCLALTLASGISFAAGSRLRAPMEAVVPFLAAIGLTRAGELAARRRK
jgi:4-amino-4-deoxy-L-arabinose transferase-like glycosyltransferase